MTFWKIILFASLFVSLLPAQDYQNNDATINKWVYDSMSLYYYWAADMPAHPDYHLPVRDFFKQLLSPKDRFSWISDRNLVTPPKSSAELFGFHYTLMPHPFNARYIVGVVTCVVPGSAADAKRLKRGMVFTRVNDKPITVQNKPAVVKALQAAAVLLQLAAVNNALADSARIAFSSSVVSQRSVYATRVFESKGRKTGYLAYFSCSEQEDGNMLRSIGQLKKEGITECIIDLRYNPGGSVASVAKLAATLVPVFDPSHIFVTYAGNTHGGVVKRSFQQAIGFSSNAAGNNMRELQALNLHLSRVYMLTSAVTASAAEALINNLSPYMQVIRIGETTLGKDEASFLIEDTRLPKQVQWVMMPTIYKIANANDRGNYAGGLAPDHRVVETSRFPLPAFGLPGDAPVDKALTLIYGNISVAVVNL